MSFRAIAFLLALLAGSIAMFFIQSRFQAWISQNLQRAPFGLVFVFLVALGVGLLLAAVDIVALDTVATIGASLIVVGVIWGWVRYHHSPRLSRWEATSKQIDMHLASDHLDAADKVMMAAHKQDDVEREQLRAAALQDRGAALEFQRRTQAELQAWNQTAALFARTVRPESAPATGAAVFSRRRQGLEADLDWIRRVLSGDSGAA